MKSVDWLWLLHPALAVLLVYPLLGMVLRLAQQTRDRRLTQAKHPPTVGRDHADLGKWLAGSVVAIVLVALAVVIATKHPLSAFEGGAARLGVLVVVLLGSVVALVTLWRVKRPMYRASFALLCWVGVIGLGLQSEVFRLVVRLRPQRPNRLVDDVPRVVLNHNTDRRGPGIPAGGSVRVNSIAHGRRVRGRAVV